MASRVRTFVFMLGYLCVTSVMPECHARIIGTDGLGVDGLPTEPSYPLAAKTKKYIVVASRAPNPNFYFSFCGALEGAPKYFSVCRRGLGLWGDECWGPRISKLIFVEHGLWDAPLTNSDVESHLDSYRWGVAAVAPQHTNFIHKLVFVCGRGDQRPDGVNWHKPGPLLLAEIAELEKRQNGEQPSKYRYEKLSIEPAIAILLSFGLAFVIGYAFGGEFAVLSFGLGWVGLYFLTRIFGVY